MGWFRRSRGRHALGAPQRVTKPAVVAAPFVPVPVPADVSFFPSGSVAVTAEPTPSPATLLPDERLSEHAVMGWDSSWLRTRLAEPTPAVDSNDLLGSIAALIVSGEAWVDSPVLPVQRGAAPAPVAAQAMTYAPAPVAQLPVQAATLQPATVETATVETATVETATVETATVETATVEHRVVDQLAVEDLAFEHSAVDLPFENLPFENVPVEHLTAEHLPVEPETVAPVPRIQLGFRDGTTASLDPDSEQAAALEELALLLSLRD